MKKLIEQLRSIDIDVDSVISHLGGNELLYIQLCNKFKNDMSFQLFQKKLLENDYEKAYLHIHTLKGVAANLGFMRLELLCMNIMHNIVDKNFENINQTIIDISQEYDRVVDTIAR